MPQFIPATVQKLVRDKVPERIQANGENPVVARLLPRALGRHLALKVREEGLELVMAHLHRDRAAMIEEAADVEEALWSFLRHERIRKRDMRSLRVERTEKGSRICALNIWREGRPLAETQIIGERTRMMEVALGIMGFLESFLAQERLPQKEVAQARLRKAMTHGRFAEGYLLLGTRK